MTAAAGRIPGGHNISILAYMILGKQEMPRSTRHAMNLFSAFDLQ